MQEKLTNFTEVRLAFAGLPAYERSQPGERASNAIIEAILINDLSQLNLDPKIRLRIDSTLERVRKMQWIKENKPMEKPFHETASTLIQRTLKLEDDISKDLLPAGAFWSGSKTKLDDALSTGYNDFMNEIRASGPEKAKAADVIGSAAYWTARNSGATWSEAEKAERFVVTSSFAPKSDQAFVHRMIFSYFLAERHNGGGKLWGK